MNKRHYVPSSPFVEAAIALLERNYAKFKNFGTMEDEIARVASKPQWKHDARAMFEHGAVTKAYLFEISHEYGLPTHLKFYIEFKALPRKWTSGTLNVTPSVTISINSEDELRKIVDAIREKRKERRILTRASGTATKGSREGGL